jgi:hypothetical protein
MSKEFKVFPGSFSCKKCEVEVNSIRLWIETLDVTWMCPEKHVSKVQLVRPKKKKSDFQDE